MWNNTRLMRPKDQVSAIGKAELQMYQLVDVFEYETGLQVCGFHVKYDGEIPQINLSYSLGNNNFNTQELINEKNDEVQELQDEFVSILKDLFSVGVDDVRYVEVTHSGQRNGYDAETRGRYHIDIRPREAWF